VLIDGVFHGDPHAGSRPLLRFSGNAPGWCPSGARPRQFGAGGPAPQRDCREARGRADRSGVLAGYIPELTKANPEAFGLAIATVSGDLCMAGDALEPFTIQSVSKAFTYTTSLATPGSTSFSTGSRSPPAGCG